MDYNFQLCLQSGTIHIKTSFLCSSRLHLFDQKYSKNRNIVKYYYNIITKRIIITD